MQTGETSKGAWEIDEINNNRDECGGKDSSMHP